MTHHQLIYRFLSINLTIILSICLSVQAEQGISESIQNRSNKRQSLQKSQEYSAKIINKTSSTDLRKSVDASSDRFIIECKENRLGVISKNRQASSRGIVSLSEKSRVKTSLQIIKNSILSARNSTSNDHGSVSEISKEFKLSFCGAAAKLSKDAKDNLINQGFKVLPDNKVYATLNESVPEIGAVQAWTSNPQMSLRGEGVKVGIIDTGIDYNHPDFGSCRRFQGCPRFGGGFDFANGDSDPLDDHGHGTHVAAIVGGRGKLLGVAPSVTFYAYKVLNSDGAGYESDIIAAIEASIDPNGDLNTSDHLDVINLSLGGYGSPDDPMSFAIDNAFYGGVLPVVAAGNDGPSIRSIGSPGLARNALSVAAGYKTGSFEGEEPYSVTDFSSRGPVVWNNMILAKPDILAPGASICAALSTRHTEYWAANCLDKAHVELSGTSMAAPHVAGAAALVKQSHPEWSPGEIRAALLSSAEKVPGSPSEKGGGKVNILEAVRLSKAPAEISFDPIQMENSSRVSISARLKARSGLRKYSIYRAPYDQLSEVNSPMTLVDEGSLGGVQTYSLLRELSVPQKIGTPQYIIITVETMDGVVSTEFGAAWHDPIEWKFPPPGESYGINSEIPLKVRVDPEGADVSYYFRRFNSDDSWIRLPESHWRPQGDITTGKYEIKAEVTIEGNTVSENNIVFISNDIPGSPGGYPVRPDNSFEGNRRFTVGTLTGNRDVTVSMHDADPRDNPFSPKQHIKIRNLSDGKLLKALTLRAVSDIRQFPRAVIASTITGDKRVYILGDCAYEQNQNSPLCRIAAYSSNQNSFDSSWSNAPFIDPLQAEFSSISIADNGNGDHSIIVNSLWGPNFPTNATGEIIVISSSGDITARWFVTGERAQLGWYASDFFSNLEPILAQLDSDPELEIVYFAEQDLNNPDLDYKGRLHAYNQDGSELPSFPIDINGLNNRGPMASADLNRDGIDEIIIQTACLYDDSNCGALYVVSADGVILKQVSQRDLGSGPGKHSLALADVNNDRIPEIMQCKQGVTVICTLRDSELRLLPGWPKSLLPSQISNYVKPVNIIAGELDNVPGVDFVVGMEEALGTALERSWEIDMIGHSRNSYLMLRSNGEQIKNPITEGSSFMNSVRLSPKLILINSLRSFSDNENPLSGGMTAWQLPTDRTSRFRVEWEGTGNGEGNTGRYIP